MFHIQVTVVLSRYNSAGNQGGKLRFDTRIAKLDRSFCRVRPWAKPGSYVGLSIQDTGEGMSPEVLDHIFEPFFTTKKPGKGTSLGLSIVYSIIKNHGGYISAESQNGEGSCFRIYLPMLLNEVKNILEKRMAEGEK